MAVTYFPFNSVLVDGEPDRPANAETLAAYMAGFFKNGVLLQEETSLQVSPYSDMSVKIHPGIGVINGKAIFNDAAEVVTLSPGSGNNYRKDRVIFRLDNVNRRMEFDVLKGTKLGYPPEAPALTRNAEVYEICLAEIVVSPLSTKVFEDEITDTRYDTDLCGISQPPTQIWDIAHGGTGAKTAAEARQNINFMGYVPFSKIEDDTAENWAALGTGIVMVDLLDSYFDWYCSDGGSFPNQGMILNCVSGKRVYQTLFDHQRILTRELGTDNAIDYLWTSFVPHDEIPQDIDQWDSATKSTNINSGAYVLYKVVGNEVRVRVTNCTTELEMTASNFSNKKLIAQGLPAPNIRQFGNGLVGNSVAQFYVEPSDDENSGYLRFFGVSDKIAAGTKIEAAFSYILDEI